MKRTTWILAILTFASPLYGDLLVTVPDVVLLPNTPNQQVQITVSADPANAGGTHAISAFNFQGVINNGVGGMVPVFQGNSLVSGNDGTDYDINASIWNAFASTEGGFAPLGPPTGFEQYAESGTSFDGAASQVTVGAGGVVVTAIIDTTGIFALPVVQTWEFEAGNSGATITPPGGAPVPFIGSSFSLLGQDLATSLGSAINFSNGSLTIAAVPEPSAYAFGFIAIGAIFCRKLFGRIVSKFRG